MKTSDSIRINFNISSPDDFYQGFLGTSLFYYLSTTLTHSLFWSFSPEQYLRQLVPSEVGLGYVGQISKWYETLYYLFLHKNTFY